VRFGPDSSLSRAYSDAQLGLVSGLSIALRFHRNLLRTVLGHEAEERVQPWAELDEHARAVNGAIDRFAANARLWATRD
jgi:hypothetical protein